MANKIIQDISSEELYSICIFTRYGWRRVEKALKGINQYSEPMRLGEGFTEFIIIWLEDHGYHFDVNDPEKIIRSRGKYIELFCCEETGDYYRFTSEGNKGLYDALLDRYTDYLQGD